MKTRELWVDKVQDKTEQCIYDLCFNPSGTQLIAAAGPHVLVYECHDGALIQLLKGHKDIVYCVCYAKDGKKFASGSADKTVIIWTHKLEGILKYSHNEAVQSMHFNPVSHQLLSCSLSDIALWSSEQKAVQKHKSGGRVNSCAWTADGQYMALGLAAGYVSIRNKSGIERLRIDCSGECPVWSLAWCPAKDEASDILCIGEWNGTLSFYSINGKLIGKERKLNFIPLKITYFPTGQYILICGSNKQCILFSSDGIQLATIGTFSSWAWSCAVHPEINQIAIGCQDGKIMNLECTWNRIHGLYKDKYAYRENMTDVLIQHLVTNQKVRIKCKDLIKKIAVYKDRLAVQLPEQVIVYEPTGSQPEDMHYRVRNKLAKSFEFSLFAVTTNNLVFHLDNRIQSLSFSGTIEAEWIMDAAICYTKVVGGPSGHERILIALKNGQVMEIHMDNPFSALLAQVDGPIRCVDISPMKEKLAVVGENGTLSVFNIHTNSKIQEFQDVYSVAFNSAFEDMMCFSGQDYLSIKVANFNEYKQKFSGIIVGLNASKIYCLYDLTIITMELPLSSLMYQYLEAEMFKEAYAIGCLGVIAEKDWFALGVAAFDNLEFDIAYEAFARKKNLSYIEAVLDVQEKYKTGEWDKEACKATAAASTGRLREAAKLYQKAGLQQQALNMYSDLRMFDIAQEFIASGNSQDRISLLRRKAEWAKSLGEPRAAAEMFLSAGDVQRAIDIISENNWVDMLIKVGRQLDKAERENLTEIAKKLRQLGAIHGAAEIFSRLGDDPDVADALVDAHAWKEAFELAEKNPKLKFRVYGPYARYLAETGSFSEAQKAFQIAGQPEESMGVLRTLADNAIAEKRFGDASYFFWLLSQITLELKKNPEEIKARFLEYYDKADVYYAYHEVYKYVEEPFTALLPETWFSISRFLLTKIQNVKLDSISKLTIMYTLVKQARLLGANKLAMQLLDRLKRMRVANQQLLRHIETWTLAIKSCPYRDPEELLPLCNRCSTYNSLLPANNASGSSCAQCGLKFQYSFVQFEILPLVEFELEPGITDEEAERLIEESAKPLEEAPATENQFTLSAASHTDLFMARLVQYEGNVGGSTVTVGRNVLKSMDSSSVLIVKWPKPFTTRYFRNLLPDLQVTHCKSCLKLFHLDDFELALLRNKHCPFCRTPSDPVANQNA